MCVTKITLLMGAMGDDGGISPYSPVFCNPGSVAIKLLIASCTMVNFCQNCARAAGDLSALESGGGKGGM